MPSTCGDVPILVDADVTAASGKALVAKLSSGNAEDGMPNFVLVHGAWHGGWCYRYTANELRGKGHMVVTPTLTGVGERFHASSEAITLENSHSRRHRLH